MKCCLFRYTVLFAVTFLLAIIVCHFGQLMPWYYLFRKFNTIKNNTSSFINFVFYVYLVAVAIAFVFVLPTGIVQAVTNQSIGNQALFTIQILFKINDYLFRIECYY